MAHVCTKHPPTPSRHLRMGAIVNLTPVLLLTYQDESVSTAPYKGPPHTRALCSLWADLLLWLIAPHCQRYPHPHLPKGDPQAFPFRTTFPSQLDTWSPVQASWHSDSPILVPHSSRECISFLQSPWRVTTERTV